MLKDHMIRKLKMNLKLVPKDRKLLKSSHVRKYLKIVEKLVEKRMTDQDASRKMALSMALGVPLKIHGDGRIELISDFYGEPTKKCLKKRV